MENVKNATSVNNESAESRGMIKVPLITKIAYGSGDVACNLSIGVVTTLLTLFYTDYAGISIKIVGMVMLISRIFDGISDLIMGFIVSHTKSKWGQSRPWILWSSIPFSLSIVLLFTVPHTSSATAQFIYLFVTYNFCTTICYTALNLPYGSLSAMMTRDSKERDMVSVFRMAMSPFGRILIGVCTMPMVKAFGDDQRAFVITAAIWSVIALALLLFCFIKCEEKVVIPAREKQDKKKAKGSGMATLKALVTNQYFWSLTALWMLKNCSDTVVGTLLPYYCKYIMHNDTWVYSVLYFSEMIACVIVVMICPLFMRKYGKRNCVLFGAVAAIVGQVFFIINPYSFTMALITSIIRGIGTGPLCACMFGMLGDVVEFGQWKTHLRQESYIFAAGSVGSKIAPGLVTALITSMLSASGYIASVTGGVQQPQEALDTIITLLKFGPVVVWGIVLVITILYQLDKKYDKIMADLAVREANGEM